MADEKKVRKALGDLLSDADLSDDEIADDIRSFGIDPQAAKERLWAKTQVLIAAERRKQLAAARAELETKKQQPPKVRRGLRLPRPELIARIRFYGGAAEAYFRGKQPEDLPDEELHSLLEDLESVSDDE